MIKTKIGAGGWFIITDSASAILIGAGPNNADNHVMLIRDIQNNVFIDNEGEKVYNRKYYVNLSIIFSEGSQDVQANLPANLALGTTVDVTEALWVKADGTTLEFASGKVRIKDGGVIVGKINASALESGLELVGGTKVGVKITAGSNTLEHSGGGIRVKAQGIDSNELKVLAVQAVHLNADTKGAGIVSGGGTAMSVDVSGSTVTISGNALEVTPASLNGSKIVAGSLGVNEMANHMKYFTIPVDLNALHQGANSDLKINKNFRILGVTGIVTQTIANSGGGNFTIEMIANGVSQLVHSIADATAVDTPIVFGAFASAPLDLSASDFTTVFNNLQFVLGQSAAAMTAGAVKLDIHCLLLP